MSVTHLSLDISVCLRFYSYFHSSVTLALSLPLFLSQRRIVMLNAEMDKGVEMWKERQEEAKRAEEHKKSLLFKPKGRLLMKKKSQS